MSIDTMSTGGPDQADRPERPAVSGYGAWTGFQIQVDRSDWHPRCRAFYEYWLSISSPGRLPSRKHISPEDIVPLLPRVWMLDVFRSPLRFRYRLVGTGEVLTLGRDPTGQWLDEAHPEFLTNRVVSDRYRFMAECGRPTWRHGTARWRQDPLHRTFENCIVPLAVDGVTVDIIFAFSIAFSADGNPVTV
jgi:hypothetical protein